MVFALRGLMPNSAARWIFSVAGGFAELSIQILFFRDVDFPR